MGDVWIRTADQGLIRAAKVTEIRTSRGSVHEETGYAVTVVAGGKAFHVIDDSEFVGAQAERLDYARRLQDALLLAMDTARGAEASMVISYEKDREGWMLTLASDLARDFPRLSYPKD
jgi:hypothetical protein